MNTQISIEQQNDRVNRGLEIYNNGKITKLNDKEYLVKDRYIVQNLYDDVFTCTCKDFEYRTDMIKDCKHITGVYFHILNGA